MGADLLVMLGILFATIIMPGPDMLLISKYSLSRDPKAAMFCNFGITLGVVFHIIFALIGLAALMAAGGLFYQIFKLAGALYLIYLGWQSWRSGTTLKTINKRTKPDYKKAFRQGLLTNLLNIKVMIFMLVIFTQVIDPSYTLPQKLVFAAVLLISAFLFWCIFILFIRRPKIYKRLKKTERHINMVFGSLLILFGILLAVSP